LPSLAPILIEFFHCNVILSRRVAHCNQVAIQLFPRIRGSAWDATAARLCLAVPRAAHRQSVTTSINPASAIRLSFVGMPLYNGEQRSTSMTTLLVTVDVKDDRKVVLTLPPDVPVGKAELQISINTPSGETKKARTSLAEWAETNAENRGSQISSEDVESFTGRRY
jgi:hypothetical protein